MASAKDRRMTVEQANCSENFQAWVARLSPAALADMINMLALEIREHDIGDHDALGQIAEAVRVHHATGVQQLVDAFVVVETSRAPRGQSGGPI